jgi:hypothetical protein
MRMIQGMHYFSHCLCFLNLICCEINAQFPSLNPNPVTLYLNNILRYIYTLVFNFFCLFLSFHNVSSPLMLWGKRISIQLLNNAIITRIIGGNINHRKKCMSLVLMKFPFTVMLQSIIMLQKQVSVPASNTA